MKIALVVPGGLHPSGTEQVVPSWLALFERLAASHELHAFVLKHLPEPTTYSLRGFTVHDLGRPSAPFGQRRWAQERALARALADRGPFDVIHGFFADPAGQLAARAGRRLGIPSIVTCDSGEFVGLPAIEYGSQRTGRGRRAVAEACALATRVHVCSQFMAALAAAHRIETTIVPLTSIIAGASVRSSRHGNSGRPFRIVQVASLSRVKNQRLLIDALKAVRSTIDAHLDLAGEDTLAGELQAHARTLGLDAHVTFHGFLPQERVHALLSNSDLYVQTSLHEAAGVSVLEAAASEVPTLGTRVGHVADWAPLRAVAVNDATPQSLADAIVALYADPERRRAIAARAREFAITHDATSVAGRFDELYRIVKS